MTRCARERRVFFIEEAVYDASTPRLDVQPIRLGLNLLVPHLPRMPSRDDAARMTLSLVEDVAARANVHDPILWLYTPQALSLASSLSASAVVYDCVDELGLSDGACEHALVARADVVFAGSHSLYEAKRRAHPAVFSFPSSVDTAHFGASRSRMVEPLDQIEIPRPRLGISGPIDDRLDLDLLRALAVARPDYSIVVVGPVTIDPDVLPRRQNLHYVGEKRQEELPAYMAGWDVAIVPLARNEATRFMSPTKTLEYLAAGRPVVSTSTSDGRRPFGERGLVRIADDAPAFAAAVGAAIAEEGTLAGLCRRDACDAYLAETSWDRTWANMSAILGSVLARRARPSLGSITSRSVN